MNAIQAAAAVVFYPLRFGDPDQIAAVHLIAEIELLKAAARKERGRLCPACNGKTYIAASDCECGDEDCDLCARDWMEACGLCAELGLLNDDGEPWHAAAEVSADARAAVSEWLKAITAGSCPSCRETHRGQEWPCYCECHPDKRPL